MKHEELNSHNENPNPIGVLREKLYRLAQAGVVVGAVLVPNTELHTEALTEVTPIETLEEYPGPSFEGANLLSPEVAVQVQGIITTRGHYPTNTLRTSTSRIKFAPAQESPLPENIYTPSGVVEDTSGTKLIFFLPPTEVKYTISAEVVDYLFGHELGHLSDWQKHPLLPEGERTLVKTAFGQVLQTLDADEIGSLRDFAYAQRHLLTRGLPEHHSVSGKDLLQDENELGEFWGACAGIYFDEPTKLSELSKDLFNFFDTYYTRFDPDFNPYEAKAKRAMFLDEGE